MFKSLMPNIMVDDVDKTVDFYTKNLSFSIIQSVPNEKGKLNFVILGRDTCVLSFQLKGNLIEEYPSLAVSNIKPSLTLFFIVDNIDEVYKELKDSVKVVCDMHETFYGTQEFAIYDINENIITIASK